MNSFISMNSFLDNKLSIIVDRLSILERKARKNSVSFDDVQTVSNELQAFLTKKDNFLLLCDFIQKHNYSACKVSELTTVYFKTFADIVALQNIADRLNVSVYDFEFMECETK